jgi:sRNA-binding regulator protein Hfq
MSPDINQAQADDLGALARARFGDLSAAETNLLEAAPKGELAVCGPNDNWDNPANDPAKAGEWAADREIRAELIRWICVDQAARERVDPKGIQAFGAKVVGKLGLSHVAVPFGLILRRCRLMEDVELVSTDLVELALQGTWVRSFRADRINVKGGVFLREGFRAEGEVRLAGGQVGSNLECGDSVFTNPSGVALNADGINVKGGVFLRNGFRAEGEVRLLGGQVGGNLECGDSVFTNPSGVALNADGINVKGGVFLRNGFRAEGEVRLPGAQIDGNLECDNSVFTNPSKKALNADRIKVAGYVFLRGGFSADGEVNFLNAEIGGNLECDNATLRGAPLVGVSGSGSALQADGINVKGNVFLREGFRAEGGVRLLGAQIGNTLECGNSVFTNPSGGALYADRINVKGSVFLRSGFRAEGEVRLLNAQIGSNLDCTSGTINGQLIAQGLSVRGVLFWRGIANPKETRVDLRNASVDALADQIESWPPAGKLLLDGFTYARISDAEKDARKRLEWLARQESFAPQPYRQLAKVLREEGDDVGARRVLFEMELLRRHKEDRGRLARFWSSILRFTIGFGYYPGRSLSWLLGLTVLSMILTWGGYAVGSIAPSDKDAYGPFKRDSTLPLHYERFYPPVYALENSFPLVKLGQTDRWQPDPNPQWQCISAKRVFRPICWVLSPVVLRVFRWGQICLGWFFTTMFVAGVTGIVRRE